MSAPALEHRPSPPAVAIAPAKLVQSRVHSVPGPFLVAELFFDVPLDYRQPAGETLRLFGRAALHREALEERARRRRGSAATTTAAATAAAADDDTDPRLVFNNRPWLAYLEGGPGAGNREPQNNPLTRPLLLRGYQVLFLDYRGTGLSATVSAATLRTRGDGSAEAQAAYLRHFRADSIVRDLEAVRRCLVGGGGSNTNSNGNAPWSLFGQSYGGFVSLTYLSFYPEGVREVFLTGGLAPVGRTADEVYAATYRKALQRNAAYYAKFPEDAAALRQIAAHLDAQPGGGGGGGGGRLPLPGGGALTTARLLTAGYMFGFHGGLDATHALVLRMRLDLDRWGLLTRPTLVAAEQFLPLDTMPLYALLHEAIYCSGPGVASRWAAQRVGTGLFPQQYGWLAGSGDGDGHSRLPPPEDGPPCFSCEMIYPFMFDTFPELMELKAVAQLLAAYDGWDALYDPARLAANRVPVYAASYVDDLYVDSGLARETAGRVGNLHVYETNGLYHNAIRARTDEVLAHLFRLRDDSLD